MKFLQRFGAGFLSLLLFASLAFGQVAQTGGGKGTVGGGGGSPTPAWVQITDTVQGGFGTTSTNNFASTTTNGNTIGVVFSAATGNTPTGVVANLSGGGTVALTQRATATLTLPSEDVFLYTLDSAAPVTGIAISLTSGANPVAIIFEASSATYDAANLTTTSSSASEHTATVTTTATDDLIGTFGYLLSSSVSSVHSGYAQNGATYFGYLSISNTSATGASGSKTTGFTPAASTSSNQFVFALKGQ